MFLQSILNSRVTLISEIGIRGTFRVNKLTKLGAKCHKARSQMSLSLSSHGQWL